MPVIPEPVTTTEPAQPQKTSPRSEGGNHQTIISAAKGGGIKFAGVLFEHGTRFFLGIFLARWLGPEQYGLYGLADSVFYLVVGLATLAFPPAMVRFISLFNSRRDEASIWGTLQIGLGLPLILTTIIGAVLFTFAEPIVAFTFDEPRFVPILRILACTLPFGALIAVSVSALIGFKQIKYNVLVEDIFVPVSRLILVGALALTGLTAFKAVLANTFSLVLTSVLILYLIHHVFSLKRPWRSGQRRFKEIFAFSLPNYGSHLITLFGDRLYIFLLGLLDTVTAVGLFVGATRINTISYMFYRVININSTPVIAELHGRGDYKELGRFYQTMTKWIFSFNLPMFLSILLFPTQLLSILGDEFTIGSTGLVILSIGTMIDAATGINVAMITMTGNTWLNTINSLAAVGTGLLLAFALIPTYGMIGATTAITLSLAILNTIRTIEVYVLFRLSPYNRSFIKPIIAGAAGATLAWFLSQTLFTGPGLANALVNIVFLMITYTAFIFLLRLSPEDQAVLNRLQSRFSGLLKILPTRRRP